MNEKVCVAVPKDGIEPDYTYETTVRTITIVQKYPESCMPPNIESFLDVAQYGHYNSRVRILDRTTRVRRFTL